MSVSSFLYIYAIASSNVGTTVWLVSGSITENSISSLLSAAMLVLGKVIVHTLFCECSKHPVYRICYLILKRETLSVGT